MRGNHSAPCPAWKNSVSSTKPVESVDGPGKARAGAAEINSRTAQVSNTRPARLPTDREPRPTDRAPLRKSDDATGGKGRERRSSPRRERRAYYCDNRTGSYTAWIDPVAGEVTHSSVLTVL